MYNVNIKTNPYRPTSFKHRLFEWAQANQPFTKEQFIAAVLMLKAEHNIVSKMTDEVLAKAWFSEFKNKHKVFEVTENPNSYADRGGNGPICAD